MWVEEGETVMNSRKRINQLEKQVAMLENKVEQLEEACQIPIWSGSEAYAHLILPRKPLPQIGVAEVIKMILENLDLKIVHEKAVPQKAYLMAKATVGQKEGKQ
jgi:hypothetical protein